MILLSTLIIMLIVGYAFWQEGAFNGFCNLVNLIIASMLVVNFFEPCAAFLEPQLDGTVIDNLEDAISMVVIFLAAYGGLRLAANQIAPFVIHYPHLVHMLGGMVFGLVVGYLASGFLWCVFQTLPWQDDFLSFQPRDAVKSKGSVFLRPDRVWLAFMNKLSLGVFKTGDPDGKSFDPSASFEVRYLKYRRFKRKTGEPQPFIGEPDFNNPDQW